MDYSGFDVQNWGRKTVNEHRICSDQLQNDEHSKTSAKKFQSDHGYKYTALLELPYFDTVRHHVIDAMHCLFLGTAKHMWKLWVLKLELFSASDLVTIKSCIENISAATDNGWLPKNI